MSSDSIDTTNEAAKACSCDAILSVSNYYSIAPTSLTVMVVLIIGTIQLFTLIPETDALCDLCERHVGYKELI